MKTKTVSTEILYNLSPYRQIKQSLATFGVSKTPDKVWVVSVAIDSVTQINKFLEITQSHLLSQEAADVGDRYLIQEIYNVSPESYLLDHSRMQSQIELLLKIYELL